MKEFSEKLENQMNSKNYRGWEKFEHQSQMRFKAWMLEQSIYATPSIAIFVLYFTWGIIQDIDMPFGQNYDFFDGWFIFWMIVAAGVNTLSLIFFKPIFSKIMEKQIKEITEDVYKKGAKFATTKQYNEEIDKFLISEFEASKDKNIFDTFVIPTQQLTQADDRRFEVSPEHLKFARIALSTGLCIMGSPGKGKSVLINRIIAQIPTDANTKTVVIDVKGEFVEKFYNPEMDYILCPADLRSVKFQLRDMIRTHIDAGVISDILVADDKQSQDPHWVAAARAVMEGILIKAAKRKLSNREIFEMISEPEKLSQLKEDDDIRFIVGNYLKISDSGVVDKETSSILTSLARKAKVLQYLKYLDELDNDSIEFKEWLSNGKGGKLFLLATDNLSRVFSPLYGVIASYLISSILEMPDNKNLNFYFILDELPRLGKALGENLEKALAVGRSKGIKIVMAMQGYSQIKKAFGELEAESILDTANSYVVFQSNVGAQFLEKHFGKTTVLRNEESWSIGMDPTSDRETMGKKEVKEALIDDAEINRLKVFEFYAKIEGCSDVVKGRLAAQFVKSKGIEKYIENPKMTIVSLENEMKFIIAHIQNRFIDTLNVTARAHVNKETVKAIM